MPFVKLPGGLVAHVKVAKARRRRCSAWNGPVGAQIRCQHWAEYQCDYKVGVEQTCDAHLCARHAHQVAADVHHCPGHHARSVQQAQRVQHKLFTDLLEAS